MLTEASDRPAAGADGGDLGRGRILLVGAVVVLALVFVLHASAWIGGGFGYSLDGFNGAVWGQGARAAVDAPIANRLGGVQPDGHAYANHPPLTVWTAAVGSAVSGDSPVGVRLPAVLASVAALALLALLLRDAGVDPAAVVVGLAAAATTSMFLAYGAMLDTPVVSLPCGLAALAGAQRAWRGRPPPPPLLAGPAALACLSGWQAAVLAAVAVVLCALVDRRSALWLAAGGVVGAALTAGWIAWVHGSLRPLFEQATLRSGDAEQSVSWLTAQQRHLGDLYGPVLLVVVAVGLVAALLPVRRAVGGPAVVPRWAAPVLVGTRPLALALVVVVGGYTLVFRNGSAVHDYWTFWGVAVTAVAVAALADHATGGVRRAGAPTVVVGALALVVAVGVGGLGVARGSDAEDRIRTGLDLVDVMDRAPEAAAPTDVGIAVYDQPGTLPWADYAVDGRSVHADDPAALRALPPELPVVVVLRGPPSDALRQRATVIRGPFALVPAGVLADHLDG